ncbi:hypothetical protein RJ640_008179 [Escallonia rubra]|uniref:Cytochrome P450 n=1 Tax=Escallonia rubra TaxID=112253 RepID=A0AA88RNJ1_9ASTE|nr:hypothetical protein RJ640_008179 [Escallonia rubra]
MEFLFSLPLLLCFILLTYLSLHVFLKKKRPLLAGENHSNDQEMPLLPPGRTGLPLIGESLDYFSKLQNNVIEKFVTERRNKYSNKVFKTSLLGQPMAILCGPEGNKFLFSNEKKFVQVWFSSSYDKIFPKTENATNTQDYKRVRKMLPSFLKMDTLSKYVGMMDMVMKQRLHTHWRNRQEVVVAPTLSKFTLALACRFFLSIDDPKKVEELTKPIEDVEAGLLSMPINLPGTALNHAIKASKYMRNEVAAIVRQRKIDLSDKSASSTQDILSHMLLTTDESGEFFSESNIVSNLFGLIEGGYTTVNSALTFIMKYLAELPHVYDEVLREQIEIANSKEKDEMLAWEDLRKMKYSWNVAQEVLRLMPPGVGAFREAITDFSYAGYLIPKGWKVNKDLLDVQLGTSMFALYFSF